MKCLKKSVENVWKFIKFIKTNIKLLLVVMLWFSWLAYLLYKGEKMLKIMDNNGVLAISGFLLYLVFYVPKIEKYLIQFANDNQQEDNTDTNLVFEKFCEKRDIKGFKKDILNIFVGYEYLNNYDKKEVQEENSYTNSNIQTQMKQAKLNTYNNSYLTFCLLIDRCKTINFKENNDYQENEKPYCFQEIAEAFGLDWNGRRYLCYIANVLNQIFKFTEQQNNQEDTIPTINASTVTKFERDNFNKWFCNGHIRGSGRHCYPKYTLIEGKENREYILELCKIVKEAKKDKIEEWKKDFYGYLTNNKGTFDILDKDKLDEIYGEYNKTETKMSYQKLEEKTKENNKSKPNGGNNNNNKKTDDDKKNGCKNK